MYTLAILTMFSKHSSSLTIILKYFHEILLGPKADKLLHLSMVLVNKKDSTEICYSTRVRTDFGLGLGLGP